MQNRGWSCGPAGLVLAGALLASAVLAACGGPITSPSIGPSEIATVAPGTGGGHEPSPLPEATPQPMPSGHPAQAQWLLRRIDAASGEILAEHYVADQLAAVWSAAGDLWATTYADPYLYRIDPDAG